MAGSTRGTQDEDLQINLGLAGRGPASSASVSCRESFFLHLLTQMLT